MVGVMALLCFFHGRERRFMEGWRGSGSPVFWRSELLITRDCNVSNRPNTGLGMLRMAEIAFSIRHEERAMKSNHSLGAGPNAPLAHCTLPSPPAIFPHTTPLHRQLFHTHTHIYSTSHKLWNMCSEDWKHTEPLKWHPLSGHFIKSIVGAHLFLEESDIPEALVMPFDIIW